MPSYPARSLVRSIGLLGLGFLLFAPLAVFSAVTKAENSAFQLEVSIDKGAMLCRLVHRQSQTELAAAYDYPLPTTGTPVIVAVSDGVRISTELRGGLRITHDIRLPAGKPWLEEDISIENPNSYPFALPKGRSGFVLPITMDGAKPTGKMASFQFTAIPFVREPNGGNKQRAEYTLSDILTKQRSSSLRSAEGFWKQGQVRTTYIYAEGLAETVFPEFASEGWCIHNGEFGFVISKYSQTGMEWALLDRVPITRDAIGFRWGGFGIYQGDPEHGAWLQPGETYHFGTTRLTAFRGGMNEGFYAFRSEMEARGMGCPKGFNAPVHWNELYDNKLYWLGQSGQDLPENRTKYYTLDDMKQEAAKARAIGCEALYLDPGWDTNFASKLWDEARLGTLASFSAMLQRDYGLSLSLHTPLSGWCNPFSYPQETMRMNAEGERIDGSLCAASSQYRDETVKRLLALAKDGAQFFMFDGSMYHRECFDPNHGHIIPARRQEHVAANNEIARRVHASYPKLQIEMHDQMVGGSRLRYVPTYFGYGNGGFDTVWAYELMWDPMRDLVGGHSIALYYYNLAYSIPLYLHIDLRKDTDQGLMFWWNASTVRHLGIGGTHESPAVQKMHHAAMATYMRLKPYFASGVFYGIDETTHAHRHPTQSTAVINCFNLTDKPAVRKISFDPARFGLDPSRVYKVSGATATGSGSGLILEATIPAYGHALIELN